MKFYIGVTDTHWFEFLSEINSEDVNFWQPSGRTSFKAIASSAPFLFKLKHPYNAIGGIGFFVSHTFLPFSFAWEVFGERNGVANFEEFYNIIQSHRASDNSLTKNPSIGCIVLTNPVFFKKEDWIEVPPNWSPNIVQGKGYDTNDPVGEKLWDKVVSVLSKYHFDNDEIGKKSQFTLEEPEPLYYQKVLSKVRIGQDAFRVLITDAYTRKCAITGERTLPVLEAAHIKPFAKSGPYFISNGLLLRSDVHKLFDKGYLTISSDLKVEVSGRIKEEFENGREYYKYHGNNLITLPSRAIDKPSRTFLEWHNEHVFKG